MRTALRMAAVFAVTLAGAASQTDEAAVRALEAKWDEATLKGDAAALDKILADGFIETGEDGKVRTKAEIIRELRAGNVKYQSANTDDVKVYLHGNAAVVSGRWRGTYSYKGRTTSLLERFTNFHVKRNGVWRCVAAHGSAIR